VRPGDLGPHLDINTFRIALREVGATIHNDYTKVGVPAVVVEWQGVLAYITQAEDGIWLRRLNSKTFKPFDHRVFIVDGEAHVVETRNDAFEKLPAVTHGLISRFRNGTLNIEDIRNENFQALEEEFKTAHNPGAREAAMVRALLDLPTSWKAKASLAPIKSC